MTLVLENVGVVVDGLQTIYDASLQLERGTMNVLLGPTLAGKTTLMRLMAGLDVPTSGRVLVDGRDATGVPVRKRSVAMVYQQFVNYPTLSVYENIASPLRVARLGKQEIDERVRRIAGILRIDSLLDRSPIEISGGQQQRTAIARAIVAEADLVLLDEPLANLDYKLREELREELPRILADTNAVLVYATTEPQEALQLGGKTATLHEGRIVQFGPTADVYHRPNSLESARAFSDPPLNEMTGQKLDGSIRLGDSHHIEIVGGLADMPDGSYTLAFRSEIVRLDRPWQHSLSISAEVAVTEISGSESFVHVETALGRFVCVEAGVSVLQPGQQLDLHVDADRVFIFDKAGMLVSGTSD